MKYVVNGLIWDLFYKQGPDALGYLPEVILASDSRPVAEQVAERYAHGGGWNPFSGFSTKQVGADGRMVLSYSGDPPQRMIAECIHPLTGEVIRLFESSWLLVKKTDGSHEISRVD